MRLLQVPLSLGHIRQIHEAAGVPWMVGEDVSILLPGSTVLMLFVIDHGEVETRLQMVGMDGEFFFIVLKSCRQIAAVLQRDPKIVGGHRDTHTGPEPQEHGPAQYGKPEAVRHCSLSYRPR